MKTDVTKSCHSRIGACVVLTILLFTHGCSSPSDTSVKPYAGMSQPDTRVALMPGDEVEIKFFYTPQLNELQYIRADGKITMQLIGEVHAAGRSPSELQQVLEQKYAGLIERPAVAVFPRNLSHRRAFVGGAVNQPGMLEMPGNMTAMEAIMHAGGFDMKEAELSNIVVIRRENNEMRSYCLNLEDAMQGKEPPRPFYLHAQDIVFVQRSGVVKTAQWIDQYINKMIPLGFTYFYNTGTGNSTIGLDTSSR